MCELPWAQVGEAAVCVGENITLQLTGEPVWHFETALTRSNGVIVNAKVAARVA